MDPLLVQFAIAELPRVVGGIRDAFNRENPNDPPPTNEEVMAAMEVAFESSRLKDENWKAAHPEK
jgi:hypothetical protein